MSGKAIKRAIALTLFLALFLADIMPLATAAKSFAAGTDPVVVSDDDNYLTLTVNPTGRFSLKANKGVPRRTTDDGKTLLSESFTTFRVGGVDYIYGNTYGSDGSVAAIIQEPQAMGSTVVTVWRVGNLEITQTLDLVTGGTDPNAGNLMVTYDVINTGGSAVQVGTRVLLDTLLGQYDAASVAEPGQENYLTNETVFTGSNIPTTWRAVDEALMPGIMTYGKVPTGGAPAPDRMVIAHWAGISQSKWDYEIDPNLNFTETNNAYGSADSAVALYWNPAEVAAGTTTTYVTLYGLGEIDAQEDAQNWDFDLRVLAPNSLSLNEDQDGYAGNPFAISLEIDNTIGRTFPLDRVSATLDLRLSRGVLRLADDEAATKSLSPGYVMGGRIRTLSWRVEAMASYGPRVAKYRIDFTFDDVDIDNQTMITKTRSVSGMILIPAIAGDPPPLQVLGITPNVIHLAEKNRQVVLRGGGFDILLPDDTVWTLKLIRTVKETDVITIDHRDENYVIIDSDRMMVTLPNSLFPGGEPKEETYNLVLDAGPQGKFTQTVAFTRNDNYLTRVYGILIAYQILDGVSATKRYALEPVESEKKLAERKATLGDMLLLEFRGEISAMRGTLPGSQGTYNGLYYTMRPGTTINGKVTFQLDPELTELYGEDGQFITAYEHEGNVTVEGYGAIALPGWPFHAGTWEILLTESVNHYLASEFEDSAVRIQWSRRAALYSPINYIGILPVIINGLWFRPNREIRFNGKVLLLWDLVMRDRSAGDMTSMLNLWNAGVDVQKADYQVNAQSSQLMGLKAQGEVGILNNFIKGVNFGAHGYAAIDTWTNYFEIEVNIHFMVIDFDGKIVLKDLGGELMPDTISLFVGGSPGIPLVTPYPVVYITHGGGGFAGLADTLAGRYNVVPPLKLHVAGGLSIAKVLNLKEVTLTVGFTELSFMGKVSIFIIPVLKDIGGQLRYDDATGSFEAKIGAAIDLLGTLKGDAGLSVRYVPGADYGLFGPVWLGGWAKCYTEIPSFIPVVGGKKIDGWGFEIGTSRIYGDAVIASIPVWVEYRWGSNGITFGADKPTWLGGKLPDSESGSGGSGAGLMAMSSMAFMDGAMIEGPGAVDESGSAQFEQMVFGSNFNLVGVSENNSLPLGQDGITTRIVDEKQAPGQGLNGEGSSTGKLGAMGMQMDSMGMGAQSEEEPVVTSNSTFTEHLVRMEGLDNGLLVLRFVGDTEAYSSLSFADVEVKKPGWVRTEEDEEGDEGGVSYNYQLLLDDPDDSTDDATANCLFQTIEADESSSGQIERIISIGIPRPEDGVWTVLTKVSATSVALIDAKSSPKIDNVTLTSSDPTGHAFGVSWVVQNLEGDETVSLLLASGEQNEEGDLIDPGTLIMQKGQPASGISAYTIGFAGLLPDTVASGTYYIRAVLQRIEGSEILNISSAYSSTPITVVNPYEPATPTGLSVVPAGNGYLSVEWDIQDDADGHAVQVLDSTGKAIDDLGIIQVDAEVATGTQTRQGIILGGSYEAAPVPPEGEEEGEENGELPEGQFGIVQGESYIISLRAYKNVGGIDYLSPDLRSNGVTVPDPNPPKLSVTLANAEGTTLRLIEGQLGTKESAPGMQDGQPATPEIYVSGTSDVRITVTSDIALESLQIKSTGETLAQSSDVPGGEPVTHTVTLNEGTQLIDIAGTTPVGDFSDASIRVKVDTTPPSLLIEPPVVTGNTATLIGQTEPGAVVEVNNVQVSVAENGAFTASEDITGKMAAVFEVRATDAEGNMSSGRQEALRSGNIQEVELLLSQPSFAPARKYSIEQGQSQVFKLVARDKGNNVYDIPAGLTDFEWLEGGDLFEQEADGQWKAIGTGTAVLSAGFSVSDDYGFYDTTAVEVRALGTPAPSFNEAPVVVKPVADKALVVGASTNVNLSEIFQDPEGEPLQWQVEAMDPLGADVTLGQLSDSQWTYTASAGDVGKTYSVEMRATETGAEGLYGALSFRVNVAAAGPGPGPSEPSTPREPSRTVLTDHIRTDDDRLLDDVLRRYGIARLALGTDGEVELSAGALDALGRVNYPLTLVGDGITVEFPAGWAEPADDPSAIYRLSLKKLSDEERRATIKGTSAGSSSGVVEVCGKVFDLSALLQQSGNSTPIDEFEKPVKVTIDLSDQDLTAEQIAELTAVRFEKDQNGNVVPVTLGGEYDPVKKTFTFYTGRFSLYAVTESREPQTVINLTIDSPVITVNGEEMTIDVAPQLIGNRTMIPVRFVAEGMGADVEWIEETETVVITLDGIEVILTIGRTDPGAGLDVAPQLIGGRTMVPIRYICESLGAVVNWDGETMSVEIVK